MRQRLFILGAVGVASTLMATNTRADESVVIPAEHVPSSSLAQLGLAGLQPISDQQGMEIRGQNASHVPNGVPGAAGDLLNYVPPPNNALSTPGNGTPVLGTLGNGTANGVLRTLFGFGS